MQCPRCEGIELTDLFSCPQCGREYRAARDGALVERWLGPISLVLYPVTFAKRPQEEAERIAGELYAASQPGRRSIFGSLTAAELQGLLSEIQLELDTPTQSVQGILDLAQDESDLREYLGLVVAGVASLVARR